VSLFKISDMLWSSRICLRKVQFSHNFEKYNLKYVVISLYSSFLKVGWNDFRIDLIRKIFDLVPSRRLSFITALEHKFFVDLRDLSIEVFSEMQSTYQII
jgi:hypothetical protein